MLGDTNLLETVYKIGFQTRHIPCTGHALRACVWILKTWSEGGKKMLTLTGNHWEHVRLWAKNTGLPEGNGRLLSNINEQGLWFLGNALAQTMWLGRGKWACLRMCLRNGCDVNVGLRMTLIQPATGLHRSKWSRFAYLYFMIASSLLRWWSSLHSHGINCYSRVCSMGSKTSPFPIYESS